MQIPKRRYDTNPQQNLDPHITQQKADQMQAELEKMIKIIRPKLVKEVEEHAKLGDFSENAAYQLAKGKLRGLNNRILVLQNKLNQAIIIPNCTQGDCVQIGSTVTVEINGEKKTFQILGSQETNPSQGIISHNSPIGAALIGHKAGETVKTEINGRIIEYKIIEVK